MINTLNLNRRTFIKSVGATFVLSQFPVWIACQKKTSVLSTQQAQILQKILTILFPADSLINIDKINVIGLIESYLSDKRIDPENQNNVIKGIKWTDETSEETFQKKFLSLTGKEQYKIFTIIKNKSWGEYWLSILLTLTFEALLLDPIYNININQTGWKWLNHTPGEPQPNKNNKYPEILNRKKENIIITHINQITDEKQNRF
jgi:hypothetical protein